VVGINTAIVSGGQGIGFAIPINVAKDMLSQLKTRGKVARGWLGVVIQKMTPEIAKSFGLKESEGALVADVMDQSPADKAGIKRGDVSSLTTARRSRTTRRCPGSLPRRR
jgi:serine protease Do